MQTNDGFDAGRDAAGGGSLLCAHERCPMHGEKTNLSVCRCCHRATVSSIYQPRTTMGYKRVAASGRTSLATHQA
jgi:hypothetical protein